MRKTILFPLLLILVSASVIAIGNFKIQYPFGTDVFNVSSAGNVYAAGWIKENGALLNATYWLITSVATPSDGDTTHLSSADQIYDYIASLNYVANAWDNLGDMTLADGSIYIGNTSNNPQARAITGDITLSNAGVAAVVDTAGLDYHNVTTGMPTCGAGEVLKFDGSDLSCVSSGGSDLYVNETGDTMTGNLVMDTGKNITLSTTSTVGKASGSYFQVDTTGNVLVVLV